jgi:hypothetical protein
VLGGLDVDVGLGDTVVVVEGRQTGLCAIVVKYQPGEQRIYKVMDVDDGVTVIVAAVTVTVTSGNDVQSSSTVTIVVWLASQSSSTVIVV